MFAVNTEREIKLHHTVVEDGKEPIKIAVNFKFTASEDIDYVELRKKAEDKTPLLVEDEKGNVKKTDMGTYNAFLYTMRTSLQECEGMSDLNGNPISIKDESGKVNVKIQVAVFEAIKGEKELFDKIVAAYIGNKEKNE